MVQEAPCASLRLISSAKSTASSPWQQGATVDFTQPGSRSQHGRVANRTGLTGLDGKYFNSPDLTGDPVATRVDTHLNFTSLRRDERSGLQLWPQLFGNLDGHR